MTMPLPRVLLFGHSHIGAVLQAYEAELAAGSQAFELVSYQFLRPDREHIVELDGVWRYHPDCEKELLHLIEQTRPDLRVSMLQGEQAVSAGLIAPEKPFGFYFPGEETETNSRIGIIPFDILLESCRMEFSLISGLLDTLRARDVPPAIALSPPPPIGDSQYILTSNLRHAGIAEQLARHGLPTTSWRYRIWKLYVHALRMIYEERGIAFLDPPPETCGPDGCLLQPFWSDIFHANPSYGRLLLRQIRSFVTSGF